MSPILEWFIRALGLNILVRPVQKISAREISDIRRRVMGFVAKNPGSLLRFAFHLFSLYLIRRLSMKWNRSREKITNILKNHKKWTRP